MLIYNKEITNIFTIFFSGNIRVLCRIRPVIKEDGNVSSSDVCIRHDQLNDCAINVTKADKQHSIELDRVFSQDTTQEQVCSKHSKKDLLRIFLEI